MQTCAPLSVAMDILCLGRLLTIQNFFGRLQNVEFKKDFV